MSQSLRGARLRRKDISDRVRASASRAALIGSMADAAAFGYRVFVHSRRSILGWGLAGLALAPAHAFADAPGARTLRFHNLHTGENLAAAYWEDGAYVPDAVAAFNHLLRDHRTNETHVMDMRLFDLLHDLADRLGTRGPFQVISGYRSPQTNAALADASTGVARRSLHMRGMAIDIALQDAALADLRRVALDMERGGVGYYPSPGFVHVDVGRVRSW